MGGHTSPKCKPYTLNFAEDEIVIAQDYDDIEYRTKKLIEE